MSRKLFDTWKFVRHLENHNLSRRQAVAIMTTIDTTLRNSVQHLSSTLLSPLDLELTKKSQPSVAGSNHPRQLLATLRQTDYLSLQSRTELLNREIEKLGQTFADLHSALKSEISMDLNNHKSDTRDISSEIDLRTQQVGHKLVVKISVLRTNLERLKVELTRDIIWYSCAFMLLLMLFDFILPSPPKEEKKDSKKDSKDLELALDERPVPFPKYTYFIQGRPFS